MSSKCTPPVSSSIEPALASARIKLYTDYKKPVLDRIIGYKNEISVIQYDPNVFLQLLNKITEPTSPVDPTEKLYDGMRVYFANYCYHPNDCDGNTCIPTDPSSATNDCRDNLTLIFVPTSLNSGDHLDDISNCIIIKKSDQGDEVFNLPNPATVGSKEKDTASRWIKNFQNGKGIALATDARFRTGNANFMETNSLWYSLEIIQDLIDYLTCLLTDNPPIKCVKIHIASFITPEESPQKYPSFQLSLVFEFYQPGVDKEKGQSIYFGSKSFAKMKGNNLGGGDSDTGLPCPPSTACQGSGLPKS